MRIALAADHAGYRSRTSSPPGCASRVMGQRPRHERAGKRRLSRIRARARPRRSRPEQAERGIAVCGSGIGISIAVNREPKCRCARVDDPLSAELAREHNDANVLALGARLDRQRHGQGLRYRVPRHLFRRRAPPAPRRSTFTAPAGQRLMATAADLEHDQNYRVPHGFFTSGLSRHRSCGRGRDPSRTQARADADRADRLGEYRQPAVLEAQGSVLTNKYAEGYPGPPLL